MLYSILVARKLTKSEKRRYEQMEIKIGFAPTRRSIFSAPDAVKYSNLIREKLKKLGVDFVDITEFNEDGLLYDDKDVIKAAEKFKKEKVDGIFVPHCNFGTEYAVAKLAKEMNVPVLLWGPRDESPDENGIRLRDTQCGLFATGKVLRRFRRHSLILKTAVLKTLHLKKELHTSLLCAVL